MFVCASVKWTKRLITSRDYSWRIGKSKLTESVHSSKFTQQCRKRCLVFVCAFSAATGDWENMSKQISCDCDSEQLCNNQQRNQAAHKDAGANNLHYAEHGLTTVKGQRGLMLYWRHRHNWYLKGYIRTQHRVLLDTCSRDSYSTDSFAHKL